MTKKPHPARQAPPPPLSARAVQAFAALTPDAQTDILYLLASCARISPSRLYATPAQRAAAKHFTQEVSAKKRRDQQRQGERMEIREKLNALHNRAQQRRYSYMTPAEERRREKLYKQLNARDEIGGAR